MSIELLFEEEFYAIRGACFEVYKAKDCGFLEAVYQECLGIEFEEKNIPFVSQPSNANIPNVSRADSEIILGICPLL